MSDDKVKQIQEFVDDFNKKLKEASLKFEENKNKNLNLKKSYSQINQNQNNNKFSTFFNNSKTKDKINLKRSLSNINIFYKPTIWKPNNFYPDYFERFKALQNKHEISEWEKVCNIYKLNINIILFYRKEWYYQKEVTKKKLTCLKNIILYAGNYMEIILINIQIQSNHLMN